MVVVVTPEGDRISVRKEDVQVGDVVVRPSRGAGSGGVQPDAPPGVSTREQPTPSAEELRGIPPGQREGLIAIFRTQGREVFENEADRIREETAGVEPLSEREGLIREEQIEREARQKTFVATTLFQKGKISEFEFRGLLGEAGGEFEEQRLKEGIISGFKTDEKVIRTEDLFPSPVGEVPFPESQLARDISAREMSIVEPVKTELPKGKIVDFFFGETGEKFVGLGLPGGPPLITFREIKTELEKGGLGSKTIAEFFPTTPGGVAITAGTLAAFRFLPPAGRITGEVTFGALGTKEALDVTKPSEQRIAGGIVGGLGFAGAGIETLPFGRGLIARFKPDFKPIKKSQFKDIQFEVVKDVTIGAEKFDIALIPPGSPFGFGRAAKGKPAFLRGAFGFTKKEQAAFISKEPVPIVTTQAGLVPVGGVKPGKVIPTAKEKLLFATPPDPITGLAQTRISRAGFVDLFKVPKGPIQIGLAPSRPQFIVFEEPITISGRRGFKAFGLPGTELEVLTGKEIISGGKIGETIFKGQAVVIFFGQLGKPKIPSPTFGLEKIKGFDISSTRRVQTFPITSLISPSLATRLITTTRRTPPKRRTTLPTFETTFPSIPRGPPDLFFIPSPPPTFTRPSRTKITEGFPTFPRVPSTPFQEEKKRKRIFRGDIDLGSLLPSDFFRIKRKFVRTPSLGAIKLQQLGIEVPKLPTRLERTGLAERKFLGIQELPQLGPFQRKLKRRKRK